MEKKLAQAAADLYRSAALAQRDNWTQASAKLTASGLAGLGQVMAKTSWPAQLATGSSSDMALVDYNDSQLIFELIQRGYAVALVPAETLAEGLGE